MEEQRKIQLAAPRRAQAGTTRAWRTWTRIRGAAPGGWMRNRRPVNVRRRVAPGG